MGKRNFIIATAGHVDHGKSSLVKALTNTDPDRLPEEKKRGITIELGFAHLQLPDPGDSESTLEIGVIDVPGHEDFVQNMVMGVGAADAALLVVAADDGWMPQTEEHLQILSYLGVKRGIIAVTKTDLPEADPELAEEMVREEIAGTVFANAPIVSTSVSDGRGLDELREQLSELLLNGGKRSSAEARLWVDRAFTMRGSGTVVTGTVEGSPFHAGQNVVIQPRNTPARIRGLQSFGEVVEEAVPATRTAINLPDIDVSADKGKAYICRGDVIVAAGESCDVVDVIIRKSNRQISERSPANKPLKHGARVRLHLGTSNTPARLHLASDEPVAPGGFALAQLRCESPIYAREGERFSLRDWPETATLAGGQILEIDSGKRTFRSEPQQRFLRTRADASDEIEPWITSLLERNGAVGEPSLLSQSIFDFRAVQEAVEKMASIRRLGRWLVSEKWFETLKESICRTVAEWHLKRPELPGYPLLKLRDGAAKTCPDGLFEALLTAIPGLSAAGNFVKQDKHVPKLQPELEKPCAEIRAQIAANPNEPPSRKHLLVSSGHERALKFLINIEEVVEIDADNVLGAGVRTEMREKVVTHLQANGAATTSDLRQLLGTSRRIAMPLLEQMDKEGLTLRNGDARTLRQTQ